MRSEAPARATQQSLLPDPSETEAPASSEPALLGESDAEEEPFVLGEPSDAPVKKKPPAAKPSAAPVRAVPTDVDPARYRGFKIVEDEAALADFVRELAAQRTFAVDLETTDVDPLRAEIVGWAFSWQEGLGYYLPVRGPAGQRTLDPQRVLEALKPHLQNPANVIVNQNIKYEILVLRQHGIELGEIGLDPMVGDYLLDAGARAHGLDVLAEKFLGHHPIPIRDLIGTGSKQLSMDQVDTPKVAEYAAEDAQVAFSLARVVEKELKQEQLWDLYWELERPLIRVLADMQVAGIRVDCDELARQSADVTHRLSAIVDDIYREAGGEFNIDSPLQLRKVLFEQLKLPVLKRTKTGPSTDQDVLERLALQHSLPAKIIEQRQLSKLKGTYLDALPKMVNPRTGRIHCSFNQVVAATGRLSASDPNLQNIPIRTEEGRRVRRAFLASSEGWKLLCADYSQIELRMLAHFSRDKALQEAFRLGADIHSAVAQEVFGVAEAEVTPDMRRIAKAVNFGVIYGQSPFGLAAALGIDPDEAGAFIDGYFARYAGVTRYLQQILRDCHRTGYAAHDSRPPPSDFRHSPGRHYPHATQPGRADGDQRRDSGLGGRPDQAGHAATGRPPPHRLVSRQAAAANSRRTGLRGAGRARPRVGQHGAARDGARDGVGSAPRRRPLSRRQLARRGNDRIALYVAILRAAHAVSGAFAFPVRSSPHVRH